MIIFNNTSADFVLISVENDHIFEQNEDRATVILKWTDFSKYVLPRSLLLWQNKTRYKVSSSGVFPYSFGLINYKLMLKLKVKNKLKKKKNLVHSLHLIFWNTSSIGNLNNVLFTLNHTTHSSKTLLCVVRFNVNKMLLDPAAGDLGESSQAGTAHSCIS